LLTNNKNAIAKKYVMGSEVFPKIKEPYTYNISTYFSMLLSQTGEDPAKISSFIKKNEIKIPKKLKKYDSYFIIVPNKYEAASKMILTKFEELFGPTISARIMTKEHAKHAETVVKTNKELFVSFGRKISSKDKMFGKHHLNLPVSGTLGLVCFLAWAYFFVGKIQKQNPPYFKRNIRKYVKKASGWFGSKIGVWVD